MTSVYPWKLCLVKNKWGFHCPCFSSDLRISVCFQKQRRNCKNYHFLKCKIIYIFKSIDPTKLLWDSVQRKKSQKLRTFLHFFTKQINAKFHKKRKYLRNFRIFCFSPPKFRIIFAPFRKIHFDEKMRNFAMQLAKYEIKFGIFSQEVSFAGNPSCESKIPLISLNSRLYNIQSL